jgi:hypothetical protein
VEDTVRRLAEQPEHVFEDEGLLQAAVSEAFEQAVAGNFPATLVRPNLRIAPSLGGTFVTRHARRPYAYKRFSRVPEVDLTAAQAAALTTFRGVTVDAALRAIGITLPAKVRIHIFEAGVGTTLPRMARLEKISGARRAYHQLHPLTVANASALLREPRLGVDVPSRFLASRHRIAAGQRFFYLEPIGQSPTPISAAGRESGCDATQPSDARMWISLRRGDARLALYFSEADAQQLAAQIAARPGSTAFLRALVGAATAATRAIGRGDGAVRAPREMEVEIGAEAEATRRDHRGRWLPPALRTRLRRYIRASAATALSQWARTHGQEFVRAAQDPACGVTVRVHVRGLPVNAAGPTVGSTSARAAATAVTVEPGRRRP